MNKNKWFKFYPSDFLAGIHNLEQIEVTAYIVVICELYDHEGICERDDAVMARRCRMRKVVFTKALDGLIAKGKIDFFAGSLTNKRVSNEIEARTKAAAEKARLRLEQDLAATQPRHGAAKKVNGNNGNWQTVQAYKEERIKKESSFDVEQPRGVEGYLDRKRRRGERVQ